MENLALQPAQDIVSPAHVRWLEAERAARSAETRLHQRWVVFFFSDGPAPTAAEQRRAAFLRSGATLALSEARAEKLSARWQDRPLAQSA